MLATVAATAAAVAVSACRDQAAPALVTGTAVPDSAEQVMYGLRLFVTGSGIKRAELFADTAYFYNNATRVDLRVVRTTFFTATGASDAVMTAKTGTFNTQSQQVEGRGDVKLVATDGRRLVSPHIVYDRAINQVSSDTAFTFSQPGREISGIGFRSDPGLKNVQVLNAARGSSVINRGGGRR